MSLSSIQQTTSMQRETSSTALDIHDNDDLSTCGLCKQTLNLQPVAVSWSFGRMKDLDHRQCAHIMHTVCMKKQWSMTGMKCPMCLFSSSRRMKIVSVPSLTHDYDLWFDLMNINGNVTMENVLEMLRAQYSIPNSILQEYWNDSVALDRDTLRTMPLITYIKEQLPEPPQEREWCTFSLCPRRKHIHMQDTYMLIKVVSIVAILLVCLMPLLQYI